MATMFRRLGITIWEKAILDGNGDRPSFRPDAREILSVSAILMSIFRLSDASRANSTVRSREDLTFSSLTIALPPRFDSQWQLRGLNEMWNW
jgi:hypothetical protein